MTKQDLLAKIDGFGKRCPIIAKCRKCYDRGLMSLNETVKNTIVEMVYAEKDGMRIFTDKEIENLAEMKDIVLK